MLGILQILNEIKNDLFRDTRKLMAKKYLHAKKIFETSYGCSNQEIVNRFRSNRKELFATQTGISQDHLPGR